MDRANVTTQFHGRYAGDRSTIVEDGRRWQPPFATLAAGTREHHPFEKRTGGLADDAATETRATQRDAATPPSSLADYGQ